MKSVVWILNMLLVGIGLHAQSGEIIGRVVNEDKEPVILANVTLFVDGEVVRLTSTDEGGYYTLKPISPGVYDLQVSTIEFSPVKREQIQVSNGQVLKLDLIMGVNLLDHFVVNDSRHDLINTGFAGEVDVIDYRDIEKMPIEPIDVPALTAGTYQSDSGRPIQFRGARPDATLYIVDGMRIIGTPYLIRNSVDQMQVYTGGIPAKYGDATGGVIVVETKSYRLKMY